MDKDTHLVARSHVMIGRSLCLAFALTGCGAPAGTPAAVSTAAVVSAPAVVSTAAPVDDCTLETPLVPGVPGSPGHLIPSEINPNGSSELAEMMRTMQRDLTAAREAVLAGKPVAPMHPRHRKMRCAWPTAASDRNPTFDAFAQGYLANVAALDAAPAEGRAAAFTAVLDACKACHQQSCPGPITAIDAMRLPAP
jgi:hypothetical protein